MANYMSAISALHKKFKLADPFADREFTRQISHIRNSVPYVPRKAGVFRMDTLIRMRDKKLAEQSLSGLQFWVMTLLNLYMGFRPHTSTVLEIQWLDFMMNPDGTIKMTDGVFPDTMYVNVGPEKCNKDWKRLTIHRIPTVASLKNYFTSSVYSIFLLEVYAACLRNGWRTICVQHKLCASRADGQGKAIHWHSIYGQVKMSASMMTNYVIKVLSPPASRSGRLSWRRMRSTTGGTRPSTTTISAGARGIETMARVSLW
eukprot:938224_1